jgi:short-subunit dehydrogenase
MGLAVARQLAEKGASVVIVARNEEKLLKGIAHVKVSRKLCPAWCEGRCIEK